MYVHNFNDRVFFCIFYQMIVISIMCRVIFSEYYFKDHIGNKCTLVCLCVILSKITCMFDACLSCIFVILLNKFNSIDLFRQPSPSDGSGRN